MNLDHIMSGTARRVRSLPANGISRLRMNEAPAIEVYIVHSSEPPGGMGECGTSAVMPAIANAVFAATGRRPRKLPIEAAALKQPR